jgi:hypothetical protein
LSIGLVSRSIQISQQPCQLLPDDGEIAWNRCAERLYGMWGVMLRKAVGCGG